MTAEIEDAEVEGDGRVPDFFIVGQPKAGTTALYEMLRAHPDVFMPDLKEPMYFASDLRWRFRPPRAGPLPETIEDYRRLFAAADPDQLVGEASTFYLFSRTAAAAIAEANPDARIVAILREPAALLRSLHLQLVQEGLEDVRDLETALELEPARRRGERIPRTSYRPQLLQYSQQVAYVEQLRRFHRAFPEEQILTLIYDDYRGDNERTLRRVLRFLNLDEEVEIAPTDANPSVLLRSRRAEELLHRVSTGRGPVSRAVKRAVKAVVPQPLRRRLLRAGYQRVAFTEPPPPDEELLRRLRRRFEPEVTALSDFLAVDLVSRWGYRDV